MQCDICGKKKATVHLTEIVDEQMSEMHLCEECARQKSVHMEQQFGLADLLAGLADFSKGTGKESTAAAAKTLELVCSKCGLSYDDFRKFGRLGCGHCYISFKDQLDALLKKIHGSNHHLGKMLVKSKKTSSATTKPKKNDLETLKNDLQEAIHDEDFEKAALIRDKIRELEKKG